MQLQVNRFVLGVSALALGLMVSGCATGMKSGYKSDGPADTAAISDPLEPVNRVTHAFNEVVDLGILTPIDIVYRLIVPEQGRKAVHNVVDNVKSPVYLANNLLQGDLKGALATTKRFAINTTVGVGGIMDVASNQGIPAKKADFGQTLGKWGVGTGPYLELPIFGPSSVRDTVGLGVDNLALDPLNVWARNTDRDGLLIGRAIVTGIDTKDQYRDAQESLRRDSADYYAALRSVYAQKRFSLVNDGAPAANDVP